MSDIEVATVTDFLSSFESIVVKSFPQIVMMELSIITTVVNMYFIIGKENVIGIGFGAIYVNIFVKGLLISVNSGITSIMKKYFRDHQYFKIGICFQRSLIINGTFMILITPFLAASHYLLIFFGVQEIIALKSMQYVWEMLPALYSFIFFDCTRNYLSAMGIFGPLVIIQGFTSLIHVIIAKELVFVLNLGVRGAAWAKNFSSMLSSLLMYFYVFKYQTQHPAWIEWNKASLKSIFSFARQLIVKSFKHFIQSQSFEIMAFIAIGLDYSEFSVCVCLIFTAQALFMLFLGVAKTASIEITEMIKQQQFYQAKTSACYFMATSVIIGMIMSLLLYIFKQDWIKLFYMDSETSLYMESMMPLFMITITIGGLQIMLANLLNSIGFEGYVLNFQLVTQYAIGIGLGLYLSYFNGEGLSGLWVGWACGLAVSAFCLLIKIALIDWEVAGRALLGEHS